MKEYKLIGLSKPNSGTLEKPNEEIFNLPFKLIGKFDELFTWAKTDDTFWKQSWIAVVEDNYIVEIKNK